MAVENGQIVLPSGMRYRVLVLPDTDRMTPAVAAKVRDLVKAGATVVGPKPVRSPSLANFPRCDEDVRKIGDEVTATCTVREVIAEKRRVIFDCVCKVGDLVVIEGEAMVMAPARPKG